LTATYPNPADAALAAWWQTVCNTRLPLPFRVTAAQSIVVYDYRASLDHAVQLGYGRDHPPLDIYAAGWMSGTVRRGRFGADVVEKLLLRYPARSLPGLPVNGTLWRKPDPNRPPMISRLEH
jgi:hypothetical protein